MAGKVPAPGPLEFAAPIPARTIEFSASKQDSPFPVDAEVRFGIRDASDRSVKGDKAAGWPAWIQDPEWPECADCKTPMRHVLQLQWGDLGRAWRFACAEPGN